MSLDGLVFFAFIFIAARQFRRSKRAVWTRRAKALEPLMLYLVHDVVAVYRELGRIPARIKLRFMSKAKRATLHDDLDAEWKHYWEGGDPHGFRADGGASV